MHSIWCMIFFRSNMFFFCYNRGWVYSHISTTVSRSDAAYRDLLVDHCRLGDEETVQLLNRQRSSKYLICFWYWARCEWVRPEIEDIYQCDPFVSQWVKLFCSQSVFNTNVCPCKNNRSRKQEKKNFFLQIPLNTGNRWSILSPVKLCIYLVYWYY